MKLKCNQKLDLLNLLRLTFSSLLAILIVSTLIITEPVYAYIDPGTGSMLLQFFLAILLGSIFTIKRFWYNIVAFFSPKKDPDSSNK